MKLSSLAAKNEQIPCERRKIFGRIDSRWLRIYATDWKLFLFAFTQETSESKLKNGNLCVLMDLTTGHLSSRTRCRSTMPREPVPVLHFWRLFAPMAKSFHPRQTLPWPCGWNDRQTICSRSKSWSFYFGVIHKWHQAILDHFRHPLLHRYAFYYYFVSKFFIFPPI